MKLFQLLLNILKNKGLVIFYFTKNKIKKRMSFAQRWLFSTNHKDIGLLYFIIGIVSGIVGTLFSLLMRMELSQTGDTILNGDYQFYNVAVTAHGFIMVFFFVMPTLSYGAFKTVKFVWKQHCMLEPCVINLYILYCLNLKKIK